VEKKIFIDKLILFLPNNTKEFIQQIANLIELGAKMGNVDFESVERTSTRREANVITAYFLRNTELEEVHATSGTEILNKAFLNGLLHKYQGTFEEWLIMRETFKQNKLQKLYDFILQSYEIMYTKQWEVNPPSDDSNGNSDRKEQTLESDELQAYWKKVSLCTSNNSESFIRGVFDHCRGASKKLQNNVRLFDDFEKVNEGRLIMEYCFFLSVPTIWFGKDVLGQGNIRSLMITSSEKLSEWLTFKDSLLAVDEDLYDQFLYLMNVSLGFE